MNRVEKALGALTLTAVLAGCGGTSAAESQKPSIIPYSTPNPTELVMPSPTPTEAVVKTPAPVETPELSPEQEARKAAMDYLLRISNTSQKYQNEFYLKTTVGNMSDWQHNLDAIENGGISDSTLEINWVGGQIFPVNNGLYMAYKSEGVMFLNQIQVKALNVGLTANDGGITQKFADELDFIGSYVENQFEPSDATQPKTLQEMQDWIFQPEEQPFSANSSAPRAVTYKNIEVDLVDGNWVFKGQSKFVTDPPLSTDILAWMQKPIQKIGNSYSCGPTSTYCQTYTY